MAIEITTPRVWGWDTAYVDVVWEVRPTLEDTSLWSMVVERSESQYGPWETVSGPMREQWIFRDTTIPEWRADRTWFYRVVGTHTLTNERVEGPAGANMAWPDPLAVEMTRRMGILLSEFVGRQCLVFPVRTSGTRCPVCYDAIRQRRMLEICPQCFSTGWAAGYLAPVKMWIQIDPHTQATQVGPMIEVQDHRTTGRTLPSPPLKTNDVILEAENVRWRVAAVSRTEKLRAAVHQELQLIQIQPGDPVWKLPIEADAATFFPSPMRELNPRAQRPVRRSTDSLGRDNASFTQAMLDVYMRRRSS